MARSVEAFARSIAMTVHVAEQEGRQDPKRRLSTVVERCGWKNRSESRMHDLASALADAGVFTSIDLSDLDIGLDSWVRFSRAPLDDLTKVFRDERALAFHLSRYPQELEKRLPHLGGLRHLYGGAEPEREYHHQGATLRPDLVYRSDHDTYVVVELERGDPKHESVAQVVRYVDAVEAQSDKEVVGILVTAQPRTRALIENTLGLIRQLRDSRAIHWVWYDVRIQLEEATE